MRYSGANARSPRWPISREGMPRNFWRWPAAPGFGLRRRVTLSRKPIGHSRTCARAPSAGRPSSFPDHPLEQYISHQLQHVAVRIAESPDFVFVCRRPVHDLGWTEKVDSFRLQRRPQRVDVRSIDIENCTARFPGGVLRPDEESRSTHIEEHHPTGFEQEREAEGVAIELATPGKVSRGQRDLY